MRVTESRSRAMNNSAGAGQESARRAMAATIPAELATSTSTRANANRGDAMSCPGWKCATLFADSQPSVIYLIGIDPVKLSGRSELAAKNSGLPINSDRVRHRILAPSQAL